MKLTTRRHDRDSAGMTYVYPVVSRRAQGVSVGVNLNTNNACNWRCVYCQVPDLVQGKAPEVDLALLEGELREMMLDIVRGDFLTERVPEGSRRLNDVAFSGNGEPTSSPRFREAVETVVAVLRELDLAGELKLVLITNGSLTHRPEVQAGLRLLAANRGEVWYKLDSATDAGAERLNSNRAGPARALSNLRAAAELCPTWVQTMALARNGEPPSEAEREAYLAALDELVRDGVALEGVLLYGLQRASYQPEADELSAVPTGWLEEYAERIRGAGLAVRVSP
ncbi:MAG: radical SAM protein [Planctomycetota bacterium]